MSQRETSRSIEHAAAEWAARLDRAALTAREKEVLDVWLQGDVRRRGALLQAQAVLIRHGVEQVRAMPLPVPLPLHQAQVQVQVQVQLRPLSRPVRAPGTARKGWMRFGGALAACMAIATVVLSVVDAPKAYATVKGEIRTIPLSGGSTVTLNTDTRIRVYGDQEHPRIRVLRGEVYVQSVGGGARPLVVEVDGVRLQAAHAVFNISKLENLPWHVTVRDGQVELEGFEGARKTLLASNARWSMPTSRTPGAPSPSLLAADEVERQLAWREGKLAFHGETLAEAALAFTRYSDTRIVITDPVLAGRRVIGLYAANNPAGFAHAAAALLNAEVEQSAERVLISAAD